MIEKFKELPILAKTGYIIQIVSIALILIICFAFTVLVPSEKTLTEEGLIASTPPGTFYLAACVLYFIFTIATWIKDSPAMKANHFLFFNIIAYFCSIIAWFYPLLFKEITWWPTSTSQQYIISTIAWIQFPLQFAALIISLILVIKRTKLFGEQTSIRLPWNKEVVGCFVFNLVWLILAFCSMSVVTPGAIFMIPIIVIGLCKRTKVTVIWKPFIVHAFIVLIGFLLCIQAIENYGCIGFSIFDLTLPFVVVFMSAAFVVWAINDYKRNKKFINSNNNEEGILTNQSSSFSDNHNEVFPIKKKTLLIVVASCVAGLIIGLCSMYFFFGNKTDSAPQLSYGNDSSLTEKEEPSPAINISDYVGFYADRIIGKDYTCDDMYITISYEDGHFVGRNFSHIGIRAYDLLYGEIVDGGLQFKTEEDEEFLLVLNHTGENTLTGYYEMSGLADTGEIYKEEYKVNLKKYDGPLNYE